MTLLIIAIITFLFIFLLIFGIMQYINFSQAKKKLIKKVQDAEYVDSFIDLKESVRGRQESSALSSTGWLKPWGIFCQ